MKFSYVQQLQVEVERFKNISRMTKDFKELLYFVPRVSFSKFRLNLWNMNMKSQSVQRVW